MTGAPIGLVGGDRSYQPDIIVCAAVTGLIGTIFVGLRFYTRGYILHVLGWDDWLILVSQCFSVATSIVTIYMAVLGEGLHEWLFPFKNLIISAEAGWINILFYGLSIFFGQVSLLMLYLRIWTYQYSRYATFALLAIVVAYNIFVVVAVATACIPLEAYWNFTVQATYCHPKSVWWANTYLHIGTDILIFSLPMAVISKLRFPRRQKIILFVLFAIGFFTCAISIIRLAYLIITENALDHTYDNASIAIWTCIETNTMVVIACAMTLKPLLSKLSPGLLDSHEPRASDGNAVVTIGSKRPGHNHSGRRHPWNMVDVIPEEMGSVGIDIEEQGIRQDMMEEDEKNQASSELTSNTSEPERSVNSVDNY